MQFGDNIICQIPSIIRLAYDIMLKMHLLLGRQQHLFGYN